MKKLKTGIIIGILALMLNTFASANENYCKVIPNFSSEILVVEGQADKSEQITIMLFEDGITLENYWTKIPAENIKSTTASGANTTFETTVADAENTVSFVDDFYADENGKFSHTLKLEKTGVYDVYLLYSNTGELKVVEDVSFTISGDYEDKIDELNSADKDAFIKELTTESTRIMLGFDDEANINTDEEDVAEILYASIGDGGLSYDFNENLSLYRACVAAAALNDGKDVDDSYFDYVLSNDEALAKYYAKYAANNKSVTEYLKNNNIKNTDELTEELKEAVLLIIVKNPNGYENIKNAFNDFKDITGINSPTANNTVYSNLAGKSFDSITELTDAYKKALSEVSSGSGSSGGSGGSGSSGGGKSRPIQSSAAVNATPETINKNIFDDLDSVPWAQEAIVNLAARGIINGKSDKVFGPDDYITREEFTKLVVAALADDAQPADIAFADVESTRWSYPYIAKAKGAGIITGYSDDLFGAEDLITRQDMSQIIYNAAKYKEIKTGNTDNVSVFADDDYIADYAKEAVYTLKAMGIVNGTDATHFEPQSYATRAQAAVMLYRLLLK